MRRYADLHVMPPLKDREKQSMMAHLLKTMGFSLVGLTFPAGTALAIIAALRAAFQEIGLETALRFDLSPNSRRELLDLLRKVRPVIEIVAVECSSREVLRTAVRDDRVDIFFLNSYDKDLKLDAALFRNHRPAFELSFAKLLQLGLSSHLILRLRRIMRIAMHLRLPIIVSSGASSPLQIRSPRQLASITKWLCPSLDDPSSCISENPMLVTANCKRKIMAGFVENGVSWNLGR
jgi:RNase P/RNase MRP subunit p30